MGDTTTIIVGKGLSIYEGVELEDYVFCGPSMVFTNIRLPRSEFPQVGKEFYEKTIQIDPNYAHVYYNLGNILQE